MPRGVFSEIRLTESQVLPGGFTRRLFCLGHPKDYSARSTGKYRLRKDSSEPLIGENLGRKVDQRHTEGKNKSLLSFTQLWRPLQ